MHVFGTMNVDTESAIHLKQIGKKQVEFPFYCLIVGKIFTSSGSKIIVGGNDGKIRVYSSLDKVSSHKCIGISCVHLQYIINSA